jgi:galactose mutarotase-like enzyme
MHFMEINLENDHLTVRIKQKGAELFSVVNSTSKLEYMWSGDPAVWGKTSPVLFPIVGTLMKNTFIHKGDQYKFSRHGFARDHLFEVESHTSTVAVFLLKSSEATLENYPFHFEFRLRYELAHNYLHVTYDVRNAGDEDMYFSVGGHPAFKVPLVDGSKYEDHYLEFNRIEYADRWPISKDGCIENNPQKFLVNTDRLNLSKSLFAADALVFKDLKSDRISLRSESHLHGLDFYFDGFPFLGLWAAYQADFICIEPWCGIADAIDHDLEFTKKEGIQRIISQERWLRTWKVMFY